MHLLGPPGGGAPPPWFMAQNADEQKLRVHQGTNSTVIVLARTPSSSILSTSGNLSKSANLDGSTSSSGKGSNSIENSSGAAVVDSVWARGAWLRLCAQSLAPLALLLRRSGSLEHLVVQTLVPGLGLLAHDCPTAAVPYGFGGGERTALAISSAAAAAAASSSSSSSAAAAISPGGAADDASAVTAQSNGTELALTGPASIPASMPVLELPFPKDKVEVDLAYEAAKTALARAACPDEHGQRPWGVILRVNDATDTALPW